MKQIYRLNIINLNLLNNYILNIYLKKGKYEGTRENDIFISFCFFLKKLNVVKYSFNSYLYFYLFHK